MQMIKSFGETLKSLKDMCCMKSVTLAQYLGYDISYISKWCANKNLPSGRNITHILEELSRIFSREVHNLNMLDTFNKEYEVECENTNDVYNHIKVILEDAYDRTKKSENMAKRNSNKTIFGEEEVSKFINDRITEILSVGGKTVDIYCTLDILNTDIIFQKRDLNINNPNINLKIGCNVSRFSNKNLRDMYNLHYVLSSFVNCNIQIYDDKEFRKTNVLLVKDEFAVIYSLNEEERVDFCVTLTDAEELNKIYTSLNYRFKSSNILIDSVSNKELKDNRYIFNFYNSRKFNFLFNLEFDFLDPKKMMDKIKIDNEEEFINKQIVNLQSIVEKKLENSNINIFIHKSSLDNYIYSSVLLYSKDKASEILKRIECLIEYMKVNKKIKFYMLEEVNIYESYKNSLSVYFGDNFLLMKKHNCNNEQEILYYIVKNKGILGYIDEVCNKIKNTRYSREITMDDLRSFLNDYRNLL